MNPGNYIINIVTIILTSDYGNYIMNIVTIIFTSDMALIYLYMAVAPDDDLGLISEEEEHQTFCSETSPI